MKHLNKSLSVLLSIFMLLSVFGGMAFAADTEGETETHSIELQYFSEKWFDITCTPSLTDIPTGQHVRLEITRKFPCASWPDSRSIWDDNGNYFAGLTRMDDGFYAEFDMPDSDLHLHFTGFGISHTNKNYSLASSYTFADTDQPYTVNGQTATGWKTMLCVYCGETSEWWGDVTAYLIEQSATNEAVTLDFFHFAAYDEARQRPISASQYAIPGQYVYFKVNDVRCLPVRKINIKAINETDPDDEIAFTYSNGYYCFTMPEYPVKINLAVDAVEKFHNYVEFNVQNFTAPTCIEPGGYDYNEWCEYCHARNDGGELLHKELPALGHTEAYPVSENEIEATCTENGSYDVVTYCETCGEQLHRVTKTQAPLGHIDEDGDGLCDRCGTAMDDATQPDSSKTDGSVCPWCGKTDHDIWWIGFVHSILSFVKTIVEKLSFVK